MWFIKRACRVRFSTSNTQSNEKGHHPTCKCELLKHFTWLNTGPSNPWNFHTVWDFTGLKYRQPKSNTRFSYFILMRIVFIPTNARKIVYTVTPLGTKCFYHLFFVYFCWKKKGLMKSVTVKTKSLSLSSHVINLYKPMRYTVFTWRC